MSAPNLIIPDVMAKNAPLHQWRMGGNLAQCVQQVVMSGDRIETIAFTHATHGLAAELALKTEQRAVMIAYLADDEAVDPPAVSLSLTHALQATKATRCSARCDTALVFK